MPFGYTTFCLFPQQTYHPLSHFPSCPEDLSFGLWYCLCPSPAIIQPSKPQHQPIQCLSLWVLLSSTSNGLHSPPTSMVHSQVPPLYKPSTPQIQRVISCHSASPTIFLNFNESLNPPSPPISLLCLHYMTQQVYTLGSITSSVLVSIELSLPTSFDLKGWINTIASLLQIHI